MLTRRRREPGEQRAVCDSARIHSSEGAIGPRVQRLYRPGCRCRTDELWTEGNVDLQPSHGDEQSQGTSPANGACAECGRDGTARACLRTTGGHSRSRMGCLRAVTSSSIAKRTWTWIEGPGVLRLPVKTRFRRPFARQPITTDCLGGQRKMTSRLTATFLDDVKAALMTRRLQWRGMAGGGSASGCVRW